MWKVKSPATGQHMMQAAAWRVQRTAIREDWQAEQQVAAEADAFAQSQTQRVSR
jgi:hypothetical protein